MKQNRGQKDYYSWLTYSKDIERLAEKIKKNRRRFINIFGLPRGGLVPAVSLSHLLGKPMIFDVKNISKKTIVIDDIVDTGRTINRLFGKVPFRPFICALYYNASAPVKPDIYIRRKTNWVMFPWETMKSSKYDSTI